MMMGIGFATGVRQVVYSSAVTVFIVCGFALFVFVKYRFGENLRRALYSITGFRQMLRMRDERRETDWLFTLVANVLFVWMAGVFVSVSLPLFGGRPLWGSFAATVPVFMVVAVAIYGLKAGVWYLLGVVFSVEAFSELYLYVLFLHYGVAGAVVFLPVAVMPFVAEDVVFYVFYGVVALVAVLYFLRQWRIFQIIRGMGVSVFRSILYLCALEFLPLLVCFKGCKIMSEYIL